MKAAMVDLSIVVVARHLLEELDNVGVRMFGVVERVVEGGLVLAVVSDGGVLCVDLVAGTVDSVPQKLHDLRQKPRIH